MQKIIFFLAFYLVMSILTFYVSSKESLPFKLKEVANNNLAAVEKVLGKPSELNDETFKGRLETFKVKKGKYKNGTVEITFIEGGARYIYIKLEDCKRWQRVSEDMQKCLEFQSYYGDYLYPEDAWNLLGELGLNKNATAEFSNSILTRWRNLSGIYEISMFDDGKGRISYINILTNERYE